MPDLLQYPFTIVHLSGNSKQRRKQRRIFAKNFKSLKAEKLLQGEKTFNYYYWRNYSYESFTYHGFNSITS